jgi:glycosyltransferase involved in cell wall biosynthesis
VTVRHVALNLGYLVPGETGGTEIYARMLVPALKAQRPDLRITALAAPELAGELRTAPWSDGLAVKRLPVSGRTRVRRVLGEQTAVPIAARSAGAEVLHSLASTAPVLTPGLANVVTVHDLLYRTQPEAHRGVMGRGMSMLVPAAARAADRIIVGSRHTRDEVVAHLHVSPDKITVVHHGAGADPAAAATPERELRERYRLGDAPLVLSVSARRGHKNLDRLVQAMSRLDRALLVLPGYAQPDDDTLSGRGGGSVRVLGWVPSEDLEGLYAAARCLAFPSLGEGFGLPVVEAMRRGLPVACSNAQSLREVAGDAALLFDPTSVDAIADAIARLLADDALRADIAERGRRHAQKFSWSRAAEGTLAAYDVAVGASRR